MTMPHERTRSVIGTREFLEQLRMRDDIPADVRKDAVWCLRHFPTASDLKVAGYASTRGGSENPFGTSPDYDEHKANMLKLAAKAARAFPAELSPQKITREGHHHITNPQNNSESDMRSDSSIVKDAALTVFIAEPLTERMITLPREGDTPEDVAQRQEYLDIITMRDSEKKSVRQAEFIKSCEGLSTEETVNRAKLFQGVDVSRFKIIKMVG